MFEALNLSSSRPENGICVQKHVRIVPFPPSERSRFFPLVPSITKHPVCIEPTMNARWSYRFHNRRDKNSSSLVPRCPVFHTLSLSLFLPLPRFPLSSRLPHGLMEQARPTFDRTKDYRPDPFSRNLPFPSKIDSCEPPLRSPLL